MSMPKLARSAAATFALAIPSIANADIVNGSFESKYQGWTLTKQAESATFATATVVQSGQQVDMGGTVLDYIDQMSVANYSSGLPLTGRATDGKWQALLLQNGPATIQLSQVVTLPEHAQLTFDLAYRNWGTSFSAQQTFRVQVLDADTDAVLANVFETHKGANAMLAMTQQTFDLEALSTMNVKLQFEVIAEKHFLDVELDHVRITSLASDGGTLECPSCDRALDEAEPESTDEIGGGCSTGFGGGPAAALAALALVALRRRRR